MIPMTTCLMMWRIPNISKIQRASFVCQWMDEWAIYWNRSKCNERAWRNQRNEWMNEWMTDWLTETDRLTDWLTDWMNEWMDIFLTCLWHVVNHLTKSASRIERIGEASGYMDRSLTVAPSDLRLHSSGIKCCLRCLCSEIWKTKLKALSATPCPAHNVWKLLISREHPGPKMQKLLRFPTVFGGQ